MDSTSDSHLYAGKVDLDLFNKPIHIFVTTVIFQIIIIIITIIIAVIIIIIN